MSANLYKIYLRALSELDPEGLVRTHFSALSREGGWDAIAVGKAAVPMARGLQVGLPPGVLQRGFLLTKNGHLAHVETDLSDRWEAYESGHPVPDQAGLAAVRSLRDWLERPDRSARVALLLSGGASSLLADPAPPLGLTDLQLLNRRLLESGRPIEEINVVRKHTSTLKGGQLGRMLVERYAMIEQVALSDIALRTHHEHTVSLIGSGPAVGDPSTVDEARRLLRRTVPDRERLRFEAALIETPAQVPIDCTVLAGPDSLRQTAERLCPAPRLAHPNWTPQVVGQIAWLADRWGELALELQARGERGVLIGVGEPTVTLQSVAPGARGGRCQELALRFARRIAGSPGIRLLAGSSDGTDGPTEYGGAVVDGRTFGELTELLGPERLLASLEGHDSSSVLESRPGLLLRTGPTGLNLTDLYLLQIE